MSVFSNGHNNAATKISFKINKVRVNFDVPNFVDKFSVGKERKDVAESKFSK